jgi:RHS repeat-associated protein
VEQARGTIYTQIVYGPGGGKLALMNGSTLSKAFVPLPGGGAAVYTSSGLTYYRHADWLGSGRLATTPVTRSMYFDVAYGPYGESYAPSGSTDVDFTGQAQDTVSGLYDFLFREYNANQGRWPWPDPAGMRAVNMGNPQTWNRYAYVGNTPLTSVDALGLLPKCSDACHYLRAMAHSAGLFARFEFTLVDEFGEIVHPDSSEGGRLPNTPLSMIYIDPGPLLAWLQKETSIPVERKFTRTFHCNSSASEVMQALESDFASFADLATGSTSTIFPPGPVTVGQQLDINVGLSAWGHTYGARTVSVNVQSVTNTSLVFQSTENHVLYPATVSFMAKDAGNGSITFTTAVNAGTNGAAGTLQFLLGGSAGEKNTWNNLLGNVAAACGN